MDSRREFLKKAALVSGGTGLFQGLPASVQRALSIDPVAGSTYLDAEHVVILMQENRSFDHCYGSLNGVRGFKDPRVITLPDGDPVWFQKNAEGEAYAPFRLNIKETKSTWTGSLPHSWTNQVDARNVGKFDKWLIAKPSGHKEFAKAPLTMGYYNREDIPFYYALADAFTVCDQNFSSSLTGTTPNRLYLWTGTIRQEPNGDAYANVRNENVGYESEVNWTTFPERLENENISWKIYQNEISLPSGFNNEEDSWLANFTDNPIEWFSQFNVRFSATHRRYMAEMLVILPSQISELETKLTKPGQDDKAVAAIKKELEAKKKLLEQAKIVREKYTDNTFEQLTDKQKSIHHRAFVTNSADAGYRTISPYSYKDGDKERIMNLPKGDVLHQFRKDVSSGKLPTVSWLIGPENFSDHPGAPWYGAWYVSEVLDILTQKPEVWKKTIFILCYDENDGYFDHVPPFVPPDPYTKGTGLVSKNIDAKIEYVKLEQDMKRKARIECRDSPIGLGYRVPLVIASPWSRGGQVCSQVFDHTSILRFLEKFLSHKKGKKISEPNISAWRRAVCGDLTAVFKDYGNEKVSLPASVKKNEFYESVHKAQFKKDPEGYQVLTRTEIENAKKSLKQSQVLVQEKGTRPACPLPYELYADGNFRPGQKDFEITMAAANNFFGPDAAGSPFMIYAAASHKTIDQKSYEKMRVWNYALEAGDKLTDSWQLNDFESMAYHLHVHGPNGFYRRFEGDAKDPLLEVNCLYLSTAGKRKATGELAIKILNRGHEQYTILVVDQTYNNINKTISIGPAGTAKAIQTVVIPTTKSFGWYDVILREQNRPGFIKQFAGHIETGRFSSTDPAMT
jgi:phospholipase C